MEKLRGLKKFTPALIGTLCGMLNGLFGAGGGIAAVPLLKASGIPLKKAHATSLRSSCRFPSSARSCTWLTGPSGFPMHGHIYQAGSLVRSWARC